MSGELPRFYPDDKPNDPTRRKAQERPAVPPSMRTRRSVAQPDDNTAGHELREQQQEQLQQERDRFETIAKQAQGQLMDLRRRTQREIQQAEQRSLARLILELVPVLDNLDLLTKSAQQAQDATSQGALMIYAELNKAMHRCGVSDISPKVGDHFDPHLHEAMSTTAGTTSGEISSVLSRGYRVDNQVLRPARVTVVR